MNRLIISKSMVIEIIFPFILGSTVVEIHSGFQSLNALISTSMVLPTL